MGKDDLDNLLDRKPQGAKSLKRPKGLTLSTDLTQQESTTAQEHKSTSAPVKDIRPSKGYKIRTDIADAYKLLAVQQKRKMYEVMEEALILYLRQNGVDIS